MNVRALGSPESARSLRGGLEALELCSVAVRSLFRVDRRLGPRRHGRAGRGLRRAGPRRVGRLLADLAVVVRAFGALLRAEVEGGAAAEEAALSDALDRLRLDRVSHAEYLLANPREHPDLWELDGALVALVDRMLLELDTAAHAKLWEDHRREVLDRHRATELFERLRSRRRRRARRRDGDAGTGGRSARGAAVAGEEGAAGAEAAAVTTRRRDGAVGLRRPLLAQREAPI